MRLLLSIFLVFLVQSVCPSGVASAQSDVRVQFHHLTTRDGLSSNSGHTILQDHQGFMWFGTGSGLNRYNGYEITAFEHGPNDSTTISGNNISDLYEDSENHLWVGTTGAGLNLFDRDTQTFSHFKIEYDNKGQIIEHGISNNSVSDMLELGNSQFWVGTDYGLNRHDPETGQFTSFYADSTDPGSLTSNRITALFEDSNNRFLIGTDRGINVWNAEQESFSTFPSNNEVADRLRQHNITEIYEDNQGLLWIGTDDGLFSYNNESETLQTYRSDYNDPRSISGNSILSILQDSRGTLWIGTENNGLNAFDRASGGFTSYTSNLDNPNSLSSNAVYSLYENDDNILWIGTYSGGINYIDRKDPKFEHYHYNGNAQHSLSTNSVTSFLEDSQGNFWVGTDGGGLNRFERETGSFYPLRHDPVDNNTLASDVVLALLEDREGYIWIGYYNGGLSRFNPETGNFRHYKYSTQDAGGLCHDDVFALYQDQEGYIWVGTNGQGVCRLNKETGAFTHFQAEEGVIRDILEDSRGDIWLGTYGGGLKLLRPGKEIWNFYEGENGLRSNVVLTIHEDRQNRFWLGTKEGGLHQFDRDSLHFTHYMTDEGMPSNEVMGIVEDGDGNLWLSTNNGISRFDPETEQFENFTIEDGLQGMEFNTLAYYKDRSGYIYFGGGNGFNRFHPDSVKQSTFVYPVVLTDFKIFNESVSVGKQSPLDRHITQAQAITLPHDASVFTLEFTALNFNNVKGVRYAYKLEGFDDEWNHVGTQRTATYTNLDPGEYTFKVKASNSDNVWTDATAVAVAIQPPFWRTTWFYMLSVFLVGALIYGTYRWRVRSIKSRNKELQEKVEEHTAELNNRNTELKKALDELNQTRSELMEKAHKAGMADVATGVLHNVGNILNSITTSAAIIEETLKNSRIKNLKQANDMLREQLDDIENFIVNNPKGKLLLEYYLKVEEPLEKEYTRLKAQTQRLHEKVDLIIEVIAAQQNLSKADVITEKVNLRELFEDTLTLQAGSIERHGMIVKRNYEQVEPVNIEKTKVMHILFNLLKNAKESMKEADVDEKILEVSCWQDENYVHLSVSDNGMGISEEDLNKIFTHGFTTKKQGHGFGLHSSANYMKEMGGKIQVDSDGPGTGATFTLSFSRSARNDSSQNQNNSRKNGSQSPGKEIVEQD